jgi:hypothetical protein
MEYSNDDDKLIKKPNEAGQEFIYLDEVVKNMEISNPDMKENVDFKSMNWMKVAFLNKNLDMRVQSKSKNLTCILLDIILYQESQLVNNAFTLLTSYYSQK